MRLFESNCKLSSPRWIYPSCSSPRSVNCFCFILFRLWFLVFILDAIIYNIFFYLKYPSRFGCKFLEPISRVRGFILWMFEGDATPVSVAFFFFLEFLAGKSSPCSRSLSMAVLFCPCLLSKQARWGCSARAWHEREMQHPVHHIFPLLNNFCPCWCSHFHLSFNCFTGTMTGVVELKLC